MQWQSKIRQSDAFFSDSKSDEHMAEFEVTSVVEPGIYMTQSAALNSLANQREMLGVRSHIQLVFKKWPSCGGCFVCAHMGSPYDIVSGPL